MIGEEKSIAVAEIVYLRKQAMEQILYHENEAARYRKQHKELSLATSKAIFDFYIRPALDRMKTPEFKRSLRITARLFKRYSGRAI